VRLNTKHPAYVIGFVTLVSAAFTAGIATLQVATAARIERNEGLRKYRALATVFAPAWDLKDLSEMSDQAILDYVNARVEPTPSRTPRETEEQPGFAYRAYAGAEHGKIVAAAIPFSGIGFWALIRGFLAVTPDFKEVLGIVFTEQKETPGLGGRIMEPQFLARFNRPARQAEGKQPLVAAPPAAGASYIYIGRGEPTGPGDPRYARSVDAITGATQTSLALEKILNQNLRRFYAAREAADKPAAPAEQ